MSNSYHTLHLFLVAATVAVALKSCTPQATPQQTPTAPGTTGNAENLTRETSETSDEFYPRVSPDGKYLYYNVIETTRTGGTVNWGNMISGGSLYTPEVITNRKTKIVRKEIGRPLTNPMKDHAADPCPMANGNILFTYMLPSKPVIAWSSPEGVGINYVAPGELGDDDSQPGVSRDGNRIVFSTNVGRTRMICSMDQRGGSFTVITEGYKPIFHPIDDNKIVYNLVVNKTVQIFMIDLKTGQKTQFTSGEYNNKDAAFARDGRYVAFVSNRENPKLARHHVYLMKADGTGVLQITEGQTDEADPTWGPDGMLYFASNAAKNYSIWKAMPRLAGSAGGMTTR